MITTMVVGVLLTVGAPTALQLSRDNRCTEWRTCRELALAAAARGEYEAFHDLAWRAVQAGPPKDPALMYLLARAQSLSGRPHDALVTLQRLAEMGVAPDAATNEDFSGTRQLPGWAELEARISRLADADSPHAVVAAASSVPSSVPSAAMVPARRSSVITLAPATEPVRFSTKQFAVSGLAYDALSQRFVVGDRLVRKLIGGSGG